MHITVYLGASCGTDPHLAQAVRELGAWIGAAGHTLVYGGSKTGLMGLLAQSALAQGGSVIGVEPECFMAQDLQYDGLTQLIVTRSMAERKAKMIQLGDAFTTRMAVAIINGDKDGGANSAVSHDVKVLKRRQCAIKEFPFPGKHEMPPDENLVEVLKWMEEVSPQTSAQRLPSPAEKD